MFSICINGSVPPGGGGGGGGVTAGWLGTESVTAAFSSTECNAMFHVVIV